MKAEPSEYETEDSDIITHWTKASSQVPPKLLCEANKTYIKLPEFKNTRIFYNSKLNKILNTPMPKYSGELKAPLAKHKI